MDDYEKNLRRRIAAAERGTWREALRADFAPWFDTLDFGFQCGDGWRDLIRTLAVEIAGIVGIPEDAPELRVVQVKEKLGELRVYLRTIPEAHAAAVHGVTTRAEARSARSCEACGKPGRLRQSRDGYWHTACGEHVID